MAWSLHWRKAWKYYKSRRNDAGHTIGCQIKNTFSKLTCQLCKDFEKDLAQNVKSDPKAFWRCNNSKLKSKLRISDIVIKADDGTTTQSDLIKTDMLNIYFAGVFIDPWETRRYASTRT